MTDATKIIYLQRDCMASMVPSGATIMLHEGTEVRITQSLGNTFTVNVYGNLARIDAKDADALGQKTADPLSELPVDATLGDKMWAQLKQVFDPEIPVNIVDLGLIYNCDIQTVDGKVTIRVLMTLTAAGCGMGPVLAEDVKRLLLFIPEIDDVEVELVFDPPWERSMMSDEAKLSLDLM